MGEKNNVATRRDLELSNTKQQLWPIVDERTSTIRTNPAQYIIPQEKRKIFIGRIKNIRTPTGFGANLNNAFTRNDRVSRLKSHDFYNILRFHIPIAIRGLTTPSVREAIYRLSRLIRWISTKIINTNEFEVMRDESHVVITLLQMQIPISFFDGQQHLMIHLMIEVRMNTYAI